MAPRNMAGGGFLVPIKSPPLHTRDGSSNVEPHDWSQVVRTTIVTIDRAGIARADLAEAIGKHLGNDEIVQV